jgi:hypothetical protein
MDKPINPVILEVMLCLSNRNRPMEWFDAESCQVCSEKRNRFTYEYNENRMFSRQYFRYE